MANVVIVADPGDTGAAAVASAIAAHHADLRVSVVSPASLSGAAWTHAVDRGGTATTNIALPGGRRIDSTDLAAVLVRSEAVPVPRFAKSSAADRNYAAAEFRALMVSWLRSLGRRVINGVDGMGLTGPSWSPQRWLVEAGRAGLRVADSDRSSCARIVEGWQGSPYDARRPYRGPVAQAARAGEIAVVTGDLVVADQTGLDAVPYLALASAARCRVLEVELAGAHVVAVRPVPFRTVTDPRAVNAVASLVARVALTTAGVPA
ncbi:hypothetical protein A5784_30945 [Mycobacterium sp. 852013-50091_SCH5140682]|uniref:hypothetical protein n=1 Tax=Mycobacterium sp. 852013-50091_SCH5140682 TaxID=1834109 RepID=UPI0007EB76BE|nr:hypothetical protein [Mycobacterium sp. 852013-50091_SCH5140682]OBC13729.1 hypothetical protein A5784_30945 [Mycobacterium sp. 852013-50091_SCH5140682]